MNSFMIVFILVGLVPFLSEAGPLAYGICQSGCNTLRSSRFYISGGGRNFCRFCGLKHGPRCLHGCVFCCRIGG
uniref:Uncharacterized protein n=1 Tax=Daphnia galeata TaxID=27404 RepID=A0A8J2W5U6_9CRUS|nr:unnamed protein product [Daphnia galeata]